MFRSNIRRLVLASSRYTTLTSKSTAPRTLRFAASPSSLISRPYTVTTQGQFTDEHITKLTTNEYHNISEEYLETLYDHLEALGESNPSVDVEYTHGVLTLDLPPHGTYVINKQPPNKQIWLSSPVSGPDRFDPVEGNWISLRTGLKLGDLLREEVSSAVGKPVELEGLDDN